MPRKAPIACMIVTWCCTANAPGRYNRQLDSNTTTINGSFEFTTNPSLLVNATLLIPNNQTASRGVLLANGTTYICADTATNQALPFTMSAQVPSNGMTIKRRLHTATC